MNWRLIRVIDACVGIILIWCYRCCPRLRRRKTQLPPQTIQRILLIKFWGIGNIFMLLPTVQAIRSYFPAASIDFLTLENNREALSVTDAADQIITISTRSILSFLRTWRIALTDLRHKRYDLIIDFEQFARFSAIVAYQTYAPCTVGFATRGQKRHYLYSNPVI